MALVMFFLVERNSSSFSAILLSVSCLTWVSSSWQRSTLFSSCSRAPSASDRAASSLLQILSISCLPVQYLYHIYHLGDRQYKSF